MPTTVRILLPIFPQNSKEVFFKGYVTLLEDNTCTIYITKYTTNNELWSKKQQKNEIYGFCGNYFPRKASRRFLNFLDIEQSFKLKISKLLLNGNQISTTSNCILMLYDYNSIKDSQAITDTKNNYFTKLVHLIQDEHRNTSEKDDKENFRNQQWLASSMFLQHIYNYWKLINWLISTIKRDKKVTVKQGNLILAVMMDILLGYIALQLLSEDKMDISIELMGVLEKLINSLYSLLKWLMGAPVGLKLNNAFNKMLGKYFSYHVQLWWLFLDVSGEKLDTILHIYHYIGYLGFTFQTAIVSDLICIATFHSYCIYVYAARLFNIQISGLIALLRLFVGRKYNPLRGGIDSCEYTNQELFVGTVAFTILLLLLPTTTLYYIVFTVVWRFRLAEQPEIRLFGHNEMPPLSHKLFEWHLYESPNRHKKLEQQPALYVNWPNSLMYVIKDFRVLSLSIQYLLAKLIYMVQTLPLYVVTLWLIQSPKVTGNILMEVINQEENAPLILRVRLFNKSIPELVHIFKPPVEVPNKVEWANLLSNVLVGKQIV